jgi:hypothetical protein
MKKILSYLFSVVALLSMASCEEEKYLFGEGPDERLQAQLTGYREALCNAPHGWLVAVGTQDRGTAGGAYRFWMKFTPDNRVVMVGDVNAATASTPQESSYRLKAMQYPTLMFDSYNYIHWPADPAPVITGGITGSGLESDYDVNLTGDLQGDEFKATGRVHKCPFIFTKATPEDMDAVTESSALTEIQNTTEALWETVFYPTVDVGGFRLQMSIGKRMSSFSYRDEDDAIQTALIPTYAEFNSNIRLMEPFDYNGITFDHIAWNANSGRYEITAAGATHEVYDFEKPFYNLEFGVGKMYNTLTVEKSALNTARGNSMLNPFLSVYNEAEAGMHTAPTRNMRRFSITFGLDAQSNEQMQLMITYTSGAGTFEAEATFKLNRDENGYVYFTDFITTDSNMTHPNTGPKIATNLLSYLLYEGTAAVGGTTIPPSGNKFKIDWAPNMTPGLVGYLGGFYVVSDPDSYMPGVLEN